MHVDAGRRCILRKLKSTWQSIPSHMKYDKVPHRAGQVETAMILQNLWLGCLYTEFLLHAILASSSEVNRERLMITAHEIVNTVLFTARQRGLLHGHRADIEWAVSRDIGSTL